VLAHALITSKSGDPAQYMFFLHGILGTRANWQGVARRFVAARPEWGAVLVDLREHGDSLGRPGPHTLRSVAADLDELERSLAISIGGALGHSFGGKVVMQWLLSREGRRTEAWVVDSSPSPSTVSHDSTATAEIIDMLEALPRSWGSREAFVAAVLEAGQPEPIARWLAMNLRRSDDGGRTFGPDLSVIRSLMEDYARTDCWDVIETPPSGSTLDVVIGDRSDVFSEADRRRVGRLASRNPRVSVHIIENAGHWVHIDAPEALVALLTSTASPQR